MDIVLANGIHLQLSSENYSQENRQQSQARETCLRVEPVMNFLKSLGVFRNNDNRKRTFHAVQSSFFWNG